MQNSHPFSETILFNLKKNVSQGCENCIMSVSLWLRMPDAQQYKNLLISSRCWVRLLISAMWFLEKSIAYIYLSLFYMAGHQATLRISIKWILAIGERPEDLIIRLMSFVEDNLWHRMDTSATMMKFQKQRRNFFLHLGMLWYSSGFELFKKTLQLCNSAVVLI